MEGDEALLAVCRAQLARCHDEHCALPAEAGVRHMVERMAILSFVIEQLDKRLEGTRFETVQVRE